MSVHAKLLAAQKAIHAISKTGFNEHFRYNFFEEREVLQVARDALNNAGLAFFYSVEDATDREVLTKKGNTEWITDVRMVCTIFDGETGEKIEGKAIGRGQDGQDKGINKAIVAGLKYWLLKVLMIPTEDDTERNENTVPEGNKRVPATPHEQPMSKQVGSARDTFSLDTVAGSPQSKAKGRTWRELLASDEGRGYVKWALDKQTTMAPNARAALTLAMQETLASPTDAVLLQDLVNRAVSVGAIDQEHVSRIEASIARADSDELRIAKDWVSVQIEKKKLSGAGV